MARCFGFPQFHNFEKCSDNKNFKVSVSTVQCYNHAGNYDENEIHRVARFCFNSYTENVES